MFSLPKSSLRRLYFLAAGMFAMGCEDYVFAGLLPALSTSLHTSVVAVAQGCAGFGIAYIVSIPLCAFLLAKNSARKVLILALSIFITGNVLTLFSTNLLIYIGGRFVAGLGGGLYLPVAVAAASQQVEGKFKGRVLSLMWGANSIGAVMGVPLGLWLAEKLSWQITIILILFLAAIALVGIVIQNQSLQVESLPPSLEAQFRLLLDPRVIAVVSVTILTATGCLGLYAYISQILTGTRTSSDLAYSLWSIGGLIGSVVIGYVMDRSGKPQTIMAVILSALFVMIFSIPFLRDLPVIGYVPFLIWGAMGWASVMPQQYSLIRLKPGYEAILVALNSSAVSLGSVVGTMLGGLALTSGLDARNLPYATAGFVLCALILAVTLVPSKGFRSKPVESH